MDKNDELVYNYFIGKLVSLRIEYWSRREEIPQEKMSEMQNRFYTHPDKALELFLKAKNDLWGYHHVLGSLKEGQ
jgi:hypothetical protein